jgi:Predicted Zn-dependent proteases and their inactivated homologs
MYSDETSVRDLLQKVLSYSQADQTEVVLHTTRSALTRFAVNHIHQNLQAEDHELRVRAVVGKKVGVATTNRLDDASLRTVVEQALAIARVQPENPEFHSLPAPQPIVPAHGYSERTAAFTAEERARRVAILVQLAKERSMEAAGAFSTNVHYNAVANSLGIFVCEPRTDAEFHAVVMADANGSGYTQNMAVDVNALDIETMAHEAVKTAWRSRNPVDIALGEYPVILDAYATADMLQHLVFMGLSATAVQEERSFMNGQFGRQLVSEKVTLYDDAHDPAGLPQSFDYEGVPTQRVVMFDHGVASAVPYDSFTAAREGVANTGHAMPAPNSEGPLPLHTMLAAGDATLEELVGGIEHGIYVKRFHYTNAVHPIKTLFTGMTRDGTFLIEHGEMTRPVKNLRFTQSILDVLRNVKALGLRRVDYIDYLPIVAPAISSETFNFTGITGV